MGCLDARTVIVHGVALSDADVARIASVGAFVVWCPASNVAMLGRTLRPRALLDAGRLALGTDSRLTGARDLLDELRVARAHGDATPAELLRLVTADASRALRLPSRGGLAPGQHADCVILRDDGGDPREALLRAARTDLRAVVRDGVPLVADPDFADWFARCGVDVVPVRLDGRPKLAARHVVPPDVVALEPGLERA